MVSRNVGPPVGAKFGDMDWGQPTSTYFQDQIEFPFFDAYLRGNVRLKQPEARVFETGANRWRAFSHWPPQEAKATSLYLLPGKAIGMEPPASTAGAAYDEYVSDPANPVPYQGGQITGRTREYMLDDQRFAAQRNDVLTYQTAPLTKDLRIAGPINADLAIETTGTDGDFIVKVIDVFPDDARQAGRLPDAAAREVMRAKFRDSYSNPSPLTPGKVESVELRASRRLPYVPSRPSPHGPNSIVLVPPGRSESAAVRGHHHRQKFRRRPFASITVPSMRRACASARFHNPCIFI